MTSLCLVLEERAKSWMNRQLQHQQVFPLLKKMLKILHIFNGSHGRILVASGDAGIVPAVSPTNRKVLGEQRNKKVKYIKRGTSAKETAQALV